MAKRKKEKNWEGRFRFDDEMRKAWKQMSNTDEIVEVLDLVGEHKDAVESAIQAMDDLEQSGLFDLAHALNNPDAEHDFSDRPQYVQNLYTALTRLNQVDPDTLNTLFDQLPEQDVAEDLNDPPRLGILKTVTQFRDPDVQRGLGKVFTILKAMGREQER